MNNISLLVFCDANDCGGGVVTYTKQIIQVMNNLNVETYLISHLPKSQKAEFFLNELINSGLKGYRCIQNTTDQKLIAELIVLYAREIKPSWYMPNYRMSAYAATVSLKRMGVKNVFIGHDDHIAYYRYATRYHSVIDFFICPAKKCEQYLLKALPATASKRILYIPHCVDIVSPNQSGKKNIYGPTSRVKLLYSGRVEFEQKNLFYLPQIARELELQGVNFEIHIVGDGENKAELESMFKTINCDYIYFHGFVERTKLLDYFDKSDITILTSKHEGFCLALAEAMANGLPAVAFDCGGVIDDYLRDGHNGFIVPHGNVELFARKIKELATDASLYEMMSQNAIRELRSNFSFPKFLENYKAVIFSETTVKFSWPLLRPHYPPQKSATFDYLIDVFGRKILKWIS